MKMVHCSPTPTPTLPRSTGGGRNTDLRAGFTLVEAVVSVLVVGMLLAPAVQMISATARSRNVGAARQSGLELAKELLTEIMECHYVTPSGSTDGVTRQTWNAVSDYSGLSESPPVSRAGTALSGFTGWTRTVLVEWVDPANPGNAAVSTDQGMKRITVTVTSPGGIVSKVVGLRSSIGLYERQPTMSTTYTSWIDVTLDGGSGAKSDSAADLVNQVP